MSSDYRDDKILEINLNKLIEETREIKEISDMYVSLVRQKILSLYCEN